MTNEWNEEISDLPLTPEEDEAFKSMPASLVSAEEKVEVGGIEVSDSDFAAFEEEEHRGEAPAIGRKPLVIYHGNCADGFSAAWVFHYVSPLIEVEFEFHAGVYGEKIPDVDNRLVYIVDFSYKPPVMEEIVSRASRVFWIDHHISAIEEIKGSVLASMRGFDVFTDTEKSGATLAWDFWADTLREEMGPMPKLLAHVEDRDLWRFKLPFTREIQAAVFAYEYTFENWDAMMRPDYALFKGPEEAEAKELSRLRDAGIMLERKHHKDIAELVKVCQRMMWIGLYHVPVTSLPYTLTSDAGHLMAKNYAEGKIFAACYWDTAEHRIFSLRSTENGLDVSKIAQNYGGGGHKNAAGFKVPRDHELARS